jgi:hypothetical protein
LHYVYEPGSLKIYRAGAEIATGSTYTPAYTIGSLFYLGTDDDTNLHANGTFSGLTTFPRAMTATEVANDYANVWAHVSGGDGYGQRLEPILWVFDNAGDAIIDNYCDATHWDWILCGGIPGSLPARTILHTVNSADGRSLTISNHQSRVFHTPTEYFTAVDASPTVNTTALLGKAINVAATTQKDLTQYPARLWVSLHDHGTNLTIAPRVELNAGSVGHTGDYRPIVADTTNKDFITYDVANIENPVQKYAIFDTPDYLVFDSVDYELWLQRTADGSADVTIDYMRAMFGFYTYVYNDVAANSDELLVDGNTAYFIDNAGGSLYKIQTVDFDLFELYPDTINHIILQTGDLGANTVTTATTTIQSITITPRWALA